MPENILVKMKTGTIEDLQSKTENQPDVPLDEGSVYFAVDTENHIGQIVYDAPDGAGGVDRVVMSTYAEHADTADSASTALVAASANSLTSSVGIDGIEFDGSSNIIHYAVCSTAGNIATKEIQKDDFSVDNGSRISVRFLYANTAQNPTLKIGNINKGICYDRFPIEANKIKENTVLDLVFDSSLDAWLCTGGVEQDIPEYNVVTDQENGLMSPADKSKLDSIEYNANYVLVSGTSPISVTTTNENVSITHGASGVTAGVYGTLSNAAINPTFGDNILIPGFTVDERGHVVIAGSHSVTIPNSVVGGNANGLMTPAQASKLEGIAYNADVGTVTSISTGAGLTGGTITSSGTIKTNLINETPLSFSSNIISQKTDSTKVYPVSLDKDNYLSVYIPWTDTTYQGRDGSSDGYLISSADLSKLDSLSQVSFTSTLNNGVKIGTITIDNTSTDLYSVGDTWIPMVGATALQNGSAGYVGTAPTAGQECYYLAGDGTWKSSPSSTQDSGLISYADLSKLQALPDASSLNELVNGKTKVLNLTYDVSNEYYVLNPTLTKKQFSDLLQSVINSDDMLILVDGNKRYYWVSLITNTATFITNNNGLEEVLVAQCSNDTLENIYFTKTVSSVDQAEKATKDASGNVISQTYLTTDDSWLVSSLSNGTISPSDYSKLQNIESEANKTILHNDQYITLYPSSGGATTQGEVTIGHITSQASGNYGQYNSTNDETISLTQDQNYYKFNSVGFTVDGAGHITAASQHSVKIPMASSSADGLISSADYRKIANNVIADVSSSGPIISTIDSNDTIVLSHTTTGANTMKGETTNLPSLQFGDSFKVLRASVDQYGLTTLLEEKTVTVPSYNVDRNRSGLMAPADKIKLDGFDEAWNYATTDYVNSALSGLDPMVFKGVVDSYSELPQKTDSSLPNYNADLANGWTYRVGTAGTYNEYNLAAGDLIIMTDTGWMGIATDSNGALFKNPNIFGNNQMLLADGTVGRVKSVAVNPLISFSYYSTEYPHAKISVGGFESDYIPIGSFTATDSAYGFTKLSDTPSTTEDSLAATPKGVNEAIKLLDTTITDSYYDEEEEETVEVTNLFANKTLATLSEADGVIQATFQPIDIDISQITTGILPISQGGTGTSLLVPNTLLMTDRTNNCFVSTSHYVDDSNLYINQDVNFSTDGLDISTVLPTASPNLFVNGDSLITDGLDLFSYTNNGATLNLHGGTSTGTSSILFHSDAPIHDENNNTDTQQSIDLSSISGFINYDVGHTLSDFVSVTQGGTYAGNGAELVVGINGNAITQNSTNSYHKSRLVLSAPSTQQLIFRNQDLLNTEYSIPTINDRNNNVILSSGAPLISTNTPNVYEYNTTLHIEDDFLSVGDYNNVDASLRTGGIYSDYIFANEFEGSLTGNADTATQWAAPTITYVDLSTDSVLTSLQGAESNPVELGVHGTLGIANGGTGSTTASGARINLGIGNVKIYEATCTTAGATGAKVATCEDLTTVPIGTLVSVSFSNNNTASTNLLTLNLNSSGALPIRLFRNGIAEILDNPSSISTGPHIFRKASSCWYIIDSVEEKITAVNSSAYVLAKSSISANKIIVTEDPTEGYIGLGSGVDFNINYPIFYTTASISTNATTKAIYSHYGDVNFSSIRSALSGDPYSTIYIKGTLDGNIVTTATDFLTTVEPTTEDGYVYIPIANTNADGVTGWFYNTGNVLAFKRGALVPMAAGSGEGAEGTIIEEIIKLIPESSTNPQDVSNRIFKWSGHTVTIYSSNVTTESTQIVSVPTDSFEFNNSTLALTTEKVEVLSSALIIDGGQGVTNGQGWFRLVALGDAPQEEAYVRVIYKYSPDDNQASIDSAAAYAQQAQAALESIESYTPHMKYYPVTISSLTSDSSNEMYPYKFVVPMTGVTATDWVDASGITDQDWAVESDQNQVIIHFSKNIENSVTVTIYWTSCSLYSAS